jgi:retron-type reverse transcriptase
MKLYSDLYNQIVSVDNLFLAWDKFKLGKGSRADVIEFEWRLEENIFTLHRELKSRSYKHGAYHAFYIHDPKQRLIHKAVVRDRIVHHAVFNILNPIFEPTFIANSFSCRVGKGTHKGVVALTKMLRRVSHNHTSSCFALKCDVLKFFASVDQDILLGILSKRIKDRQTIELLREIIYSFSSKGTYHKGLPIGNLTSQLFANIYMNEFDQFMKHQLKVRHYVRYTDDFIVVSDNIEYLKSLLSKIQRFLKTSLALELHPAKLSIRKFTQGVDFLGYVVLPHHTKLRTKTKRRMERKLGKRTDAYANKTITAESLKQTWQSYLGVMSHADCHKLKKSLILKIRAMDDKT